MPETDFAEATLYRTHGMTARLVTARKGHRCDYSHDASWGRACRTIQPGDRYVRVTLFPGHDFLDVPTPERGACCLACAEGYDGLSRLVPAPAPVGSDAGSDQ